MGELIFVEDKNVEIPCTDFTPHIKISKFRPISPRSRQNKCDSSSAIAKEIDEGEKIKAKGSDYERLIAASYVLA